jgi:anaerobic selenocysteine-containing dehydrogenase
VKREGRPELMIHPDDAEALGLADGERVEIGNQRGEVVLHAGFPARASTMCGRASSSPKGIWPNSAHERGEGINVLTGADAAAPCGGAAFHDNEGVGEGRPSSSS